MPYLIDGHNLIPSTGLRLDSPDDEIELMRVLQEFARSRRRDVEVYFDGAPPGFAGTRRLGRVTAHFVRAGSTADAAIQSKLQNLGGAARNWIVVSSDRQVQSAARQAHARSLPSSEFAGVLRSELDTTDRGTSSDKAEQALTSEEIERWSRMFNGEE